MTGPAGGADPAPAPPEEVGEVAAAKGRAIDDLVALLRPGRGSGTATVVCIPARYGPVAFGGLGVAITIAAACLDAPAGTRMHSLHGHFLRPLRADGETTVALAGEMVKAGRTLTLMRVTASQDAKPAIVATCSFTADTDGYTYDLSGIPGDVAPPEDIDPTAMPPWVEPADGEDQAALAQSDQIAEESWPWDDRWLDPSPARPDGTRESTHRHWFRIPRDLGDDVHLHTALMGYASDWTGIGGRPLKLDGDTEGMISLDHAVWFHRPPRVDQWLLQDVQALVNHGGRGTLRGVIRDRHGTIVASMAQEMLLRVV